MARHSLLVLKVPLNTKQTNQCMSADFLTVIPFQLLKFCHFYRSQWNKISARTLNVFRRTSKAYTYAVFHWSLQLFSPILSSRALQIDIHNIFVLIFTLLSFAVLVDCYAFETCNKCYVILVFILLYTPFRLAASVSCCWTWEKEGRAVKVVPGI